MDQETARTIAERLARAGGGRVESLRYKKEEAFRVKVSHDGARYTVMVLPGRGAIEVQTVLGEKKEPCHFKIYGDDEDHFMTHHWGGHVWETTSGEELRRAFAKDLRTELPEFMEEEGILDLRVKGRTLSFTVDGSSFSSAEDLLSLAARVLELAGRFPQYGKKKTPKGPKVILGSGGKVNIKDPDKVLIGGKPLSKLLGLKGKGQGQQKVRCPYCGSLVVPDKAGKCPNCAAPLG